ncbi:MAG: ADP-ribosylglycohydrolase family protein [Acidobacteriota bacterium]|nr:MAG: ADP-ribosylglycohydrolase family protein [Acidobacteriota bacterium]
MRRFSFALLLVLCCFVLGSCVQEEGVEQISIETLRDKIRGGWAGQMIGVSYGAPTEFRFREQIIPVDELPEWSKERLQNAIHQDDLYVEMTFAEVLDAKGLKATTADFGAMFRDARYSLWHANLAARRALRRGVPAGQSGEPKYNAHANDIDFQIESDFIGLMCPGLPVTSNEICWQAGRVMNYGDGIYGGMFVSGMYAAAYFEKDVRKVVEAGLACIPAESPYARVIADVLEWSAAYPDDWQRVWQLIEENWNHRDPCPDGALSSFNIDAKINGAYIALGLLYGESDFGRTLEISTRAGQDSDCNPSNAAGVLGVIHGYEGIPQDWKEGIDEIANEKFSYTKYSFKGIVESTEKRVVMAVEAAGGRLEDGLLIVKTQKTQPAELQLWDDYGSPVERISVNDPRWTWTGPWEKITQDSWDNEMPLQTTSEKGASAEVSFEGTGAILVGPYLPDGGKLDVELDGEGVGTFDVFSDEEYGKGGESIYHVFGLEAGVHTIRIETRGEPFEGSKGSVVTVKDLVVFR